MFPREVMGAQEERDTITVAPCTATPTLRTHHMHQTHALHACSQRMLCEPSETG